MECRICGVTSEMKRYSAGDATYVRCAKCGGVFLDPYPRKADNRCFLGPEVAAARQAEDLARVFYFRDRLNRLERHRNRKAAGSRLLDVGCGAGVLMEEATRRGWRVDGVELSPDLARMAAGRNPDSRVTTGDICDQGLAGAGYDAVIALDVLEHVFSPSRMVKICHDALRPGGLLLIQTPNTFSYRFRAYQGRWDMLDPGQHLTLFSPQALDGLVTANNFSVLEMRTVSGSGRETGLARRVNGLKELVLDMATLGNAMCVVARAEG